MSKSRAWPRIAALRPILGESPGICVRVASLSRRYGARWALSEVSLEIARGETLVLLGANGAGKTTLIHLLAGILDPDAGRVTFADGTDPRAPDARRRIGVAFQSLAIYPELEVFENVRFFARLYSLRGRALDDAVDEALERVGLVDRRRCRAKTLSGGMLRRLNLACAIAHRPELLLLDEPTVALDPRSHAHVVEALTRLRAGGTTIVLSTHDLDVAERLCDRAAVLESGWLVATGTIDELSRRYGSGLVEVEVERQGRTVRLRWVVDKPFDDAKRLLRSEERVKKLRVEASSLETAFFALTGRRIDEP